MMVKSSMWDLSTSQILQPLPKISKSCPSYSPMLVLDGHPGPSRCVKFNPRYAMMVTGGADLAFWLPDLSGSELENDPNEDFRQIGHGIILRSIRRYS